MARRGLSEWLQSASLIALVAALPQAALSQVAHGPELNPRDPVLLEAGDIDYQSEGLVIASGQVAVTQGDTVLLADTLAYDQSGDFVIAKGNVSLLEPSGNVYFADEVELSRDLKEGVIRHFRARMKDDSKIAARTARKIDEQRTELTRAIYSPCDCEDEDTGEPTAPQWAIRSRRALIDEKAEKITYDDVSLSLYGKPVLYSPYFSHAMPGSGNKSGLLMPEYRHNDNLGSVVKVPVYYTIAPDRDLTVTPIYTTLEGLVMAGEYRQMFNTGLLHMDGSITRPQSRDKQGAFTQEQEARWHMNGTGHFRADPLTNWGFELRRASDDTYLRRYGFNELPLLTSRAYLERFHFPGMNDRSYGSVRALGFQGLTVQDNQARIPVALPLADFSYQSDPLRYGSRFLLDSNVLALYRDDGSKSRRLSTTIGWKLPVVTPGGQIFEWRAQLRGDGYSVEDLTLAGGQRFNGTTGRLVPQADMLWRYPLITRREEMSLLIEPVVSAAVSPGGGNPETIPNEDSVAPEFTDTNLFDANRFAGYDRIENGPRASYGLRGQADFGGERTANWLLGQHYRLNNDRNFPFTNDLVSHFSDYVGKIGFNYKPVSLAYRFRLDRTDLALRRHEAEIGYDLKPLSLSLSYLSLDNDPSLANKEVITGGGGVQLSRQWRWTFSGSEDLELRQVTGASTGFIYESECTTLTLMAGRSFTRDRDVKPSTSFLFKLSLKNLE